MTSPVRTFDVWDYVVFSLMLGVSAAIGIYYACAGGKQKTTKEFLLANRNLGVLPVAISILLSFMSAILILGTPAEMYTDGTQFYIRVFGSFGCGIAALLFVPLFYPLKLTSSYEVSILLALKKRRNNKEKKKEKRKKERKI